MGDRWHLLFHAYETGEPGFTCANSTVSAHLFSNDGFLWHTVDVQPFGTQVELVSGGTMLLSTRERPKLLFSSDGQPTHLFSGASAMPNCWNEKQCHWSK